MINENINENEKKYSIMHVMKVLGTNILLGNKKDG